MKKLKEILTEINYREYKRDKSSSSKKKLNMAIKEVNSRLFQIERFLKQNKRLREEEGLGLTEYWKATADNLVKMNERIKSLQKEIKNFGLKEIMRNMSEEVPAKKVKKKLAESNASTWTKQQLDKELQLLRVGAKEAGDIDDSMAWDIADGWLDDNQGVETAIKKWYPKVSDFKGFVANHIA